MTLAKHHKPLKPGRVVLTPPTATLSTLDRRSNWWHRGDMTGSPATSPSANGPAPGAGPGRTLDGGSGGSGGSLVLAALLLVVLSLVVRTLLLVGFSIRSGSMEPTLHGCAGCSDDRVVVDRFVALTGSIERGDVVVFRDSRGWLTESGSSRAVVNSMRSSLGLSPDSREAYLVKRVIGVGGDRVEGRHGVISVNGVRLVEPYVVGESGSTTDFSVTVPRGQLWVMGDDRDSSADSRAHLSEPRDAFVPATDVVGRVLAVIWPLRHLGTLDRPPTFTQAGLERRH